jgi:glyoxylase-like metal-dependent hydrolase (beta-lactamase superfamily II)
VLITHAHSDHTGIADRARTTTAAPVWVHQADAAVADGAKPGRNDGTARSYLLRVEFYRTLVSLARRGPASFSRSLGTVSSVVMRSLAAA